MNMTISKSANSQTHLQLVLDVKLDFNEHVNNKTNKCYKFIAIMKKFSLTLSRNSLLTIYKTFVWPILDYADIINDKHFTESFKDKLEMVQYNALWFLLVQLKIHQVTVFTESGLEFLVEGR